MPGAPNPYDDMPERAFWRPAVSHRAPHEIMDLASPKSRLNRAQRIATAGSCFAQHISRRLEAGDYRVMDMEPAPTWLQRDHWPRFGYGVYSARYGNIYSAAQLRQLVARSLGQLEPEEPVWERDGRFHDPFRPTIEDGGFASENEARLSRAAHLAAVKRMLYTMDVFIFTLGLTESWTSRADGAVFPVCPGVAAGTFDADRYVFRNADYTEVVRDLGWTLRLLSRIRPEVRIILTVSPVPLVATASDHHVLTATSYSKSVLRAAAGFLADTMESVDYFPSYEMITAPAFGGRFYERNMREVSPEGVDFVMRAFFAAYCPGESEPRPGRSTAPPPADPRNAEAVVCDEILLER